MSKRHLFLSFKLKTLKTLAILTLTYNFNMLLAHAKNIYIAQEKFILKFTMKAYV